jgi:D-tyrosyl-tRNA(Tyr) deacylase
VKVLLQRVSRAAVRVDGQTVGQIGVGLVALVAVELGDSAAVADYMADKTAQLRIFPDERGRMERSVEQAGGAVLVISQFTLAGSTRRGRRPSYDRAADPQQALALYERFVGRLRALNLPVACGVFRAMMELELVNDGPVTLWLDPPPGPLDRSDPEPA